MGETHGFERTSLLCFGSGEGLEKPVFSAKTR